MELKVVSLAGISALVGTLVSGFDVIQAGDLLLSPDRLWISGAVFVSCLSIVGVAAWRMSRYSDKMLRMWRTLYGNPDEQRIGLIVRIEKDEQRIEHNQRRLDEISQDIKKILRFIDPNEANKIFDDPTDGR